MRYLICGDREYSNRDRMKKVILGVSDIDTIIHGAARGADSLAGNIAEELGITILVFPAKWNEYGKSAGPIRNTEMLVVGKPHRVLAFHDNVIESKGTRDMVTKALFKNIPVTLITEKIIFNFISIEEWNSSYKLLKELGNDNT